MDVPAEVAEGGCGGGLKCQSSGARRGAGEEAGTDLVRLELDRVPEINCRYRKSLPQRREGAQRKNWVGNRAKVGGE